MQLKRIYGIQFNTSYDCLCFEENPRDTFVTIYNDINKCLHERITDKLIAEDQLTEFNRLIRCYGLLGFLIDLYDKNLLYNRDHTASNIAKTIFFQLIALLEKDSLTKGLIKTVNCSVDNIPPET